MAVPSTGFLLGSITSSLNRDLVRFCTGDPSLPVKVAEFGHHSLTEFEVQVLGLPTVLAWIRVESRVAHMDYVFHVHTMD